MYKNRRVIALIAAGGTGSRLGVDGGKQLLEIAGMPVIVRTVKVFAEVVSIDRIIVVSNPNHIDQHEAAVRAHVHADKPIEFVAGGETRMHSVYNGLICSAGPVARHTSVLRQSSATPAEPNETREFESSLSGISECSEVGECPTRAGMSHPRHPLQKEALTRAGDTFGDTPQQEEAESSAIESARTVEESVTRLDSKTDIVLVHDGARPLVDAPTIEGAIAALIDTPDVDGVVVGHPSIDTLKVVDCTTRRIFETPDRENYWVVQTPQVFVLSQLLAAYEAAFENGFEGTDDSSLMERAGNNVMMYAGRRDNIKVTVPEDVALAEAIVSYHSVERD